MWIHIISVNTEHAAGTIGIKRFKGPLSNQACLWFDKKIYNRVVGHLTEVRPRKDDRIVLRDAVGSTYTLLAYKDLR